MCTSCIQNRFLCACVRSMYHYVSLYRSYDQKGKHPMRLQGITCNRTGSEGPKSKLCTICHGYSHFNESLRCTNWRHGFEVSIVPRYFLIVVIRKPCLVSKIKSIWTDRSLPRFSHPNPAGPAPCHPWPVPGPVPVLPDLRFNQNCLKMPVGSTRSVILTSPSSGGFQA